MVCEGSVVSNLTQVSKYPYFSFGGAIYAEGEVLIDNSRFIDNTALEMESLNSCGGAIFSCTGNVTIINTDFINNTAQNIRNDVYVRENLKIINSTYDYYYVTVIGNLTLDKRLNDYSLIDSSFGELSKLIDESGDVLTLTKDYTYIDGQDTGILINKSITIDGANHILDGAALSSIFNIVHEGVVLKNIVFKNGRSYKNAGAVNCHASNAAIVNCSFINHSNKPYAATPKVGSEYVFSGEIPTVFAYNPAQGSSNIHNEIVFFSGDSITISDSKFISNNLTGSVLSLTANNALISWCDFDANYGGTLICLFGDNTVIDSCNFQNNHAYKAIYHGGNSLIVNSTYFNNNTDFGNEFVNVSGVNFTIINPKTTPNTRNSFKYLQHLIDGADDKLILDCDYIQWDSDELVISKKFILDGSGHTLDANSSSMILKVLASDVVVKNITFKNGMALGLYHNLTGIGGAAVYWQGLNGVLANCTFLNNQAKGLLYDPYAQGETVTEENGMTIITYVQRPLGAVTNRGGAVVWLADNGKVTDCVFKNNSVDYPNFGGAIYWSGDNALVERSQFFNNSAWLGCAIYYSGNSLKVKASKFSDNTFAGMKNRDLTGDNITLIQPSLQDLAELIQDSPDCVVLDCDYFCQSGDGSILVNKTLVIDGKGHTIDGTSTLRIFKITADNVVLKNINFINGNSTLGGCILWIGDNATLINCSFKNSTSFSAGGAVAFKGSNVRIINSTFENNTVYQGPHSAFSLFEKDPTGSIYLGVMISYGGALYIQGDNALILRCRFEDNTASGYDRGYGTSQGGAIYFTGLNATVRDSGFVNNHATYGKHISDGDVKIINTTFDSSENSLWDLAQLIKDSPDCVVLNHDYFCQSGDGCILVNKTLVIDGNGHTIDGVNTLRIFKITADNVVLKNINFINGNCRLGGCVLWIVDNATIINCSFKNSISSSAGGAVALKGSNARIINSTFVNNTVASGPYSAFSLFEKDPSGIMYPAVMISYGGAVYIQGDNASVISCSFSHNTAVGYSEDDGNSKGGALYFAGLNATVKDSGFITNHASFDEHISGDADIINSTFESSVVAESDLSQIISENLVIYYKSTRKFTVKVYNKAGEPASGEMVTFIINGKIRHVISDNSGEACFKIKSKPGTYSVTTIWGDLSVVNNLIVKKRLITHNLVKKVKKTAVFKVKVLNSKGKRYAKQTVKIKFKGKTYKIKTNSKGIASFKLSKNLKKGKYTIKTTYLGFSVFNKITVKR